MSNKTHIFCYSKYTNSVTCIHEILGDICRRLAKSFHHELEKNIKISLNTLVGPKSLWTLGLVFALAAGPLEMSCGYTGSSADGSALLSIGGAHQYLSLTHWGIIFAGSHRGNIWFFFFWPGRHLYWIVFSLRREEAWAKGQIRGRICSNEAGTCSKLLLRRNFAGEN